MTSPIVSPVDDRRRWESSDDADLTCHEEPRESQAGMSRAAQAACSPSESDAPRTSASEPGVRGPHAEAHAQDGDYYAGAFLLSGHDRSGLDVEVFSASIHEGERERGVQIGMARMGGSTQDGHFGVRGEVFTAHARASFDNPDGSVGLGASIGVTVVGAEGTGTLGPASLTLGASIGSTVGGSLGVRDGDSDGNPELCGRVEFGVGTVGLCIEKWW